MQVSYDAVKRHVQTIGLNESYGAFVVRRYFSSLLTTLVPAISFPFTAKMKENLGFHLILSYTTSHYMCVDTL